MLESSENDLVDYAQRLISWNIPFIEIEASQSAFNVMEMEREMSLFKAQ